MDGNVYLADLAYVRYLTPRRAEMHEYLAGDVLALSR